MITLSTCLRFRHVQDGMRQRVAQPSAFPFHAHTHRPLSFQWKQTTNDLARDLVACLDRHGTSTQ
jgi:hypothetical protein